jgi:hypothetical protein
VLSSFPITRVINHLHTQHMHPSQCSNIGQAIHTRLPMARHLLTRILDTTRHRPRHRTPDIVSLPFKASLLHNRDPIVQAMSIGSLTTRTPHHLHPPHMAILMIAPKMRTTAGRRTLLHLTLATRMPTTKFDFISMSALTRTPLAGSDAAISPRRQRTFSRPGSMSTAASHTPPRTRRLNFAMRQICP